MKTQAAQCAASVRRDLKELFPGVKFSVKCHNYSGGDSVYVDWYDGPTEKEVAPHLYKYEKGHFNGMEDIYEYSNLNGDIPQTKYLFCKREMSPETRQNLEPQAEKIYNAMCEDIRRYLHAPHTFLHRIFYKASLKPGEVGRQIVHLDVTAGMIEDFYAITA
jgi:hypothetical protein